MLEIPDSGLAPWSWFVYGHWSFIYLCSEIWFWRCKEYSCPLSPYLRLWRMLDVPDWGLGSLSWFIKGHYAQTNMSGSFPLSQPSFSSDVCQVQLRKYAASRVGQLGGWPALAGWAKFKHQPLANQLYWMVNEQLQGLTTFISYIQFHYQKLHVSS